MLDGLELTYAIRNGTLYIVSQLAAESDFMRTKFYPVTSLVSSPGQPPTEANCDALREPHQEHHQPPALVGR